MHATSAGFRSLLNHLDLMEKTEEQTKVRSLWGRLKTAVKYETPWHGEMLKLLERLGNELYVSLDRPTKLNSPKLHKQFRR